MLCRISCIILAIVAVAALAAMTAGAAAVSPETPSGYAVIPATGSGEGVLFSAAEADMHECSLRVMSIDSTIKPGQTVHVKKNVDHSITTLNVDLKWDSPNADLSILIYSPSSVQFGPWRDSLDGNIDRQINKDIYNQDGIEQGDWEYYIKNWGTEETHYSV